MNKVSVIILTYNEEKNIYECLKSLNWADELIIVDSGSTDNTLNIAKSFTEKIISVENIAYGLKRNLGFEKASGEWIFWLDADERVNSELAGEIKNSLVNPRFDVYRINRKSYFINRFINHCGWSPDYSVRLFRRSAGIKFNDSEVHEQIIFSGIAGKLKNPILHYTDLDFEHYTAKLNNYTSLSAGELKKNGTKSGVLDIIFRPVFTFFKMYFLKLGFLDGYTGLILCILSAYHVMFKYAKNSVNSN